MSDAVKTISLIEGMPAEASPNMILTACSIRRERSRQDKIDLALATANLILGGFSGKGDTLEACRHMFTDEEFETMVADRAERKQTAVRRAQIEMLRQRMKQ